jgi:L,D-peptidoglycan transpeptidase YkuD (ErfK/YbiS/YcfS/YnhG family)
LSILDNHHLKLTTVPSRSLAKIYVRKQSGTRTRGILRAGSATFPVSLGRSGIFANKREGDGGTPRGKFRLKRLWWRSDRITRPRTALPVRSIGPADAWSEDPADRRYNRPVRRGPGEPGDRLMRDDDLYDLIIEIDHNDRPRVAGRGSAVFIHVAREGFGPTAGCVGLRRNDLLRLLERLSPQTCVYIG